MPQKEKYKLQKLKKMNLSLLVENFTLSDRISRDGKSVVEYKEPILMDDYLATLLKKLNEIMYIKG